MKRVNKTTLGAIAAVLLLAAACGEDEAGRRVVIDQNTCQSSELLRVNLNETTRIVIDNREHSENQKGLRISFLGIPFRFRGDIPRNSFIADPVSDVRLNAAPGQEVTMTVIPTFAGNFQMECGLILGTQSGATDIPFQIVP
jgi:hypothetical protein